MKEEIIDKDLVHNEEKEQDLNKYAGFGVRFLAYFIDGIIFTFIAYLIWGEEVVNTRHGLEIKFSNEQLLVPLGYLLLSWILTSSSIGKMVLGMKIIDAEGNKIKPLAAFLRTLGHIILIIGCWFILGNEKKQALHDKIARTFVVKK